MSDGILRSHASTVQAWFLLLVASFVGGSFAQCPSQSERLANLTAFPRYDVAARPSLGPGKPVDVRVQIYIASIAQVDQKQQHVAVEGYFRTEWTDHRLVQEGSCADTIPLALPARSVWQPDIYFDNSLEEWYGAGSLTIYPDGYIFRSVRFNHWLRCPMNFERLPFDEQQCFMMLGSYSSDVLNINSSAFADGVVQVPDGYDGTTEWHLAKAWGDVTTEWFGVGQNRKGYAYVWIYLDLERRPISYLVLVFGTCILFSLVAWAGLFINRTVAPARVTFAVIPVLIMLNLSNSVTSQLPPLNYLTWLTSFVFLMTLFSLSVVFEYGMVAFLMQVEAARDRQFEAFKTVATAMKKKAAEDHAAVEEDEFHHDPPKAPQCFASRKKDMEPGVSLRRCAEQSEPETTRTGIGLKPAQQFAQVYSLFDRDGSGDLGVREVQWGFRRLGQYLSMDQVREIFYRLGVHDDSLLAEDFQKLLLDVHTYMPGKAWTISYWELPPSLQLDIAFRRLYIVGVAVSVMTWLLALV